MSEIVISSDNDDDDIISYMAKPSSSTVGRRAVTNARHESKEGPIFIDDSDSDSEADVLPDWSAGSAIASSSKLGSRAVNREVLDDLDDESLETMDLEVIPLHLKTKRSRPTPTATAGPSRPTVSVLDILDSKSRSPTPDLEGPASSLKPTKKKRKSSESADSSIPKRGEAKSQSVIVDREEVRKSKEEKEAAKEEERRRKQFEKDTVKAAKEAEKSYQKKVAEVNKLRTSKNDTVREVHPYLSHDCSLPSSPIAGALPEIENRLKANRSELHYMSEESSPVSGVIKFKRHLQARWDPVSKRFIPLDTPRWVWESTVILIVTAEEVVDRVAVGGGDLQDWVRDTKTVLELVGEQVVIMIKGLGKYYSKSKSLAMREYTAAARAGLGGGSAVTSGVGKARPEKETIERELVDLQVSLVEKTEDIEDWIWNLTADIALRPYKLITKSHLAFCPQDGIKKAASPTDVLELMLQEVQGITPSAAAGVGREYPTFRDLMKGFEKVEKRGGVERGEGMLQDCEIKTLKNGTANGRKLKTALSKRVYHVFRGQDSLALA